MKSNQSKCFTRRDGKQAILDAALELFTHQGYEETSIEDLRKAAGFRSKASLYAHFTNKKAVADALSIQIFKQTEHQILIDYENAGSDSLEILTAVTRGFIRWGFNHPKEYTFRFVRNQQERLIKGQFDYTTDQFSTAYVKMLELLQNLRRDYPVRQIADEALISVALGLVSRAVIDREAFGNISMEKQVNQVLELCMGVFFAEPIPWV
ncbi:TetR/AcrR family transcriptional regulator [Acaryochloris sp. IP29b_bin.137]|uniref:TetR/AcrR family transcriptional regulator n=1 Tax=Acaryochloris sp. IP29b_bin.137 TaxID=2969217 RepID=UPI00261D9C80|nr:TetR/AcrR family transcriptional regulator [Acaryochloris sp. IP29b_bin.137]